MSIVDRVATYEDLMELPEHLVGELIDGELFASPRPSGRHERAAGALYILLRRAFDDGIDGPGGWWIMMEPELHLGSDILVPDVAGWRREHLPRFPEGAHVTVAPDWVCEVISTSSTRLDRVKKLPKYARNGVQHAWIVDPVLRTLELYRHNGKILEPVDAFTGDVTVRVEPFEAIEINLSTLWVPTPPAPQS